MLQLGQQESSYLYKALYALKGALISTTAYIYGTYIYIYIWYIHVHCFTIINMPPRSRFDSDVDEPPSKAPFPDGMSIKRPY
jgi:hypothetical protein